MRVRIRAAVVVAAVAASSAAVAGPLTQDPCDARAAVSTWSSGHGVLENLLFADGSLWVSDGARVHRFAPDATPMAGLTTEVDAAGGLAQGPDGLIYVGSGNTFVNALGRTERARVLRFDPADPDGTVAVYASGFNMPNGMTFGPAHDLFISNDADHGLIRIPRNDDGTAGEASEFAHVWGTNGLVIDPAGENLYAAITFDQRSPIERVPLSAPGSHETFVVLSAGAASLEPAVHEPDASAPLLGVKGLDDLTRDADGTLYVTANGTGEIIRVTPDGDACLVAGGLSNPSSVRIAPEDGPFADGDAATLDLYVTQFSGTITRIIVET